MARLEVGLSTKPEYVFGRDRFTGLGLGADAGKREQIVDELLHSVCSIDRVADKLVCIGIEFALVAFRERSWV